MKNSKYIIFIIAILLSIIFLSGSNESRIKKSQFIGNYLLFPYTKSISYFKTLTKLYQKYENLNEKLTETLEENRRLKEALSQNKRLRELLKLKNTSSYDLIAGEIIGINTFFNNDIIIINIGRDKGVKQGLPVISADGVVGRVITVYKDHSVVYTIYNKLFKLGVMDKRSRVQGIMENVYWRSSPQVSGLKVNSDVMIGDEIVTSNLSTFFPREIKVGTVTKIKFTEDRLFKIAEISPSVKLEEIEEVMVIKRDKMTRVQE